MGKPKYIEYDGLMFCRDEKTGYYLNSTIHKRLHRYVWEKEVGAIPPGCHIHHIDGDKSNNSLDNLTMMTAGAHQHLHSQDEARKEVNRRNIKKAIAAAPAWHHSEEGRLWHSQHAKGFVHPRYEKRCERCGKPYQGTKIQRFCSNACKSAWRRDNGLDNVTAVCEWCGKEFSVSKYASVRFCSRLCASKAHVGWRERMTQTTGGDAVEAY